MAIDRSTTDGDSNLWIETPGQRLPRLENQFQALDGRAQLRLYRDKRTGSASSRETRGSELRRCCYWLSQPSRFTRVGMDHLKKLGCFDGADHVLIRPTTWFEDLQNRDVEERHLPHQKSYRTRWRSRERPRRPFLGSTSSDDSRQQEHRAPIIVTIAPSPSCPKVRRFQTDPRRSWRQDSRRSSDIETLSDESHAPDDAHLVHPNKTYTHSSQNRVVTRTRRQSKATKNTAPESNISDEWDECNETSSESFILSPRPPSRCSGYSRSPSPLGLQSRQETSRSRSKFSNPPEHSYFRTGRFDSPASCVRGHFSRYEPEYSITSSPVRNDRSSDSEIEPDIASSCRYISPVMRVKSIRPEHIKTQSAGHSATLEPELVSSPRLPRNLGRTENRRDYGFASASIILPNEHSYHAYTLLDTGCLCSNLNLVTQEYLDDLKLAYPAYWHQFRRGFLPGGKEVSSPMGSIVLSDYVFLKFELKIKEDGSDTRLGIYKEKFYVIHIETNWELLLGNDFIRDNRESRRALHHIIKTSKNNNDQTQAIREHRERQAERAQASLNRPATSTPSSGMRQESRENGTDPARQRDPYPVSRQPPSRR